jgi:catechol 2,3-dioxygenase-like lactoylglutathione lyase family enzyme
MMLEVVVVAVSDVDRAKAFYEKLGFRLDIVYAAANNHRVVQFTSGFGSITVSESDKRLTNIRSNYEVVV